MARPQKAPTATSTTPSFARPAPNTARGPTHEQVARRAYELYLARGGQHGHHAADWAQAERELKLGRMQ